MLTPLKIITETDSRCGTALPRSGTRRSLTYRKTVGSIARFSSFQIKLTKV